MDAPPGVPGLSKDQNFLLQIKLLSCCANIAQKGTNVEKIIKIERKCQKKTLLSLSILNILQFGGNISAPKVLVFVFNISEW